MFATTPPPPYYAVIFTAHSRADATGYPEMAEEIGTLAATMPGYLGAEYVGGADGLEITVSYWIDEAAVAGWKAHIRHLVAQEKGKQHWFDHYAVRVAKVERAYTGPDGR